MGLLVLCLLVASVNGWGEVGHKAIAQLAFVRLSDASKAAVTHYLGAMHMYEVAPMPDDYAFSPDGHWSEPFHFYNMNKTDTRYYPSECPVPPSCNVYAIQNFTKVLDARGASGPFCSSENDPTEQFPCPLIWLIHVIGDVHQPLHCGYGYDRGGNDVKVTFFGEETELHAVWDTGMIYHYLDSNGGGDWYDLFQYLDSDLKSNPGREQAFANITDPVAWANESISFVVNDVYNWDPSQLAGDEPSLGQDYYNHNFPIASLRMEAAGVRLATVLNTAFQSKKPLPHFDSALKSQIALNKAKKEAQKKAKKQ